MEEKWRLEIREVAGKARRAQIKGTRMNLLEKVRRIATSYSEHLSFCNTLPEVCDERVDEALTITSWVGDFCQIVDVI